ncbi:hypothetical protein G5714_020532 [Onychostoma macrolepis]|nr:hypothetical protein G5714_020532 [Onychostoma macrolepis]
MFEWKDADAAHSYSGQTVELSTQTWQQVNKENLLETGRDEASESFNGCSSPFRLSDNFYDKAGQALVALVIGYMRFRAEGGYAIQSPNSSASIHICPTGQYQKTTALEHQAQLGKRHLSYCRHKSQPLLQLTEDGDRRDASHKQGEHALVSIHCFKCRNMADKPNMTEITSFDKTKLRKTETQEKNPLPTKETIEQERQGESTP